MNYNNIDDNEEEKICINWDAGHCSFNNIKQKKEENKKNRMIYYALVMLSVIIVIMISFILFVIINNDKQPEENTYVNSIPYSVETEEANMAVTSIVTVSPQTPEPTPIATPPQIPRRGYSEPIPQEIQSYMTGLSYKENNNISIEELSYLTIPYYDFNYNIQYGHMVVNNSVAEEVLDIFAELFDIKYPIERMELVDKYNADDFQSIEYNNTSAFNYRESTDGNGKLSRHAYGLAIDINPQINPYVNSDGTGAHQNAREYWDRNINNWTSDIAKAAYIGTDTDIYRIFTKYGWQWGGNWTSYRDYQHFQK